MTPEQSERLKDIGRSVEYWRDKEDERSVPADERQELYDLLTQTIAERDGQFDLKAHLHRQIKFSKETFGPDYDRSRIIHHIWKEIEEVQADNSLAEWVDVILLAFDGAWRSGNSPDKICAAIASKQAINESRKWPDWKQAEQGQPIEHVRENV